MRKFYGILLGIACAFTTKATTSVTSSTVSGHWTLAGSPYKIYNDINVSTGTLLQIDPGVEVIFQGNYALTVAGLLQARGTAAQPINMHVQDTTGWYNDATSAGGWQGVNFMPLSGTVDSSAFDYCNLYDMKNLGFFTSRTLTINHCNFYHSRNNGTVMTSGIVNTSAYDLSMVIDTSFTFEMNNCNVYNNHVMQGAYILGAFYGHTRILNSSFHDNIFGNKTLYLVGTRIVVDSNDIYNNVQEDTTMMGAFGGIMAADCEGQIKGNKIHNNLNVFEAEIYCDGSGLDINGNIICNNRIVGDFHACGINDGGGGIRIADLDDTAAHIYIVRNNIIANNSSTLYGAGIDVYMTSAVIANNTIINNTAPTDGAMHVFSNPALCGTPMLRIKNNIFSGNKSTAVTNNYQVHIAIAYDVEFTNNFIEQPYYKDAVGSGFTLIGDTLTNVIGSTPGLVAPTATTSVTDNALIANFKPAATSVCIDKGDTASAHPYSVDYAGQTRISNGIVDIGALEYQKPHIQSIPTVSNKSCLGIYPNPAAGIIFTVTDEARGHILLQDLSGRVIADKQAVTTITSFDVHGIPAGVYLVQWTDGATVRDVQKVVIR